MNRLRAREAHFVRCVKPNDEMEPGRLDRDLCARQLRYLGVRDTVRIRQAGYAIRYPLEEFCARYRCLLPRKGEYCVFCVLCSMAYVVCCVLCSVWCVVCAVCRVPCSVLRCVLCAVFCFVLYGVCCVLCCEVCAVFCAVWCVLCFVLCSVAYIS